jgi:hypothetical protein
MPLSINQLPSILPVSATNRLTTREIQVSLLRIDAERHFMHTEQSNNYIPIELCSSCSSRSRCEYDNRQPHQSEEASEKITLLDAGS